VIAGLPLLLAALLGIVIWLLWRLEKLQSTQLKQQVSNSLWLRRQSIDHVMVAYRQAQIDYSNGWKSIASGKLGQATEVEFHAVLSMIATQISQIYWTTHHFGADCNLIAWQELRDYADKSIRTIVASSWRSLERCVKHADLFFPPELDADQSLVEHVKMLIKQNKKVGKDIERMERTIDTQSEEDNA
jgi:hypothetical protein